MFAICKYLSKKLRMSFILFYGRWFLPIAKKEPLYFVLGSIIKNKFAGNPIENPSQKMIDNYHSRLLHGIRDLFDKHKGLYGWEKKELVFV